MRHATCRLLAALSFAGCQPIDILIVRPDPCKEIGALVDGKRDGLEQHDEGKSCTSCPEGLLTLPNYAAVVPGGETVIFGGDRRPVILRPEFTPSADLLEVPVTPPPAVNLRIWVTSIPSDDWLNDTMAPERLAIAEDYACACAGAYNKLGSSLGGRAVCGYLRRNVSLVTIGWRDERVGFRIGEVSVHDVHDSTLEQVGFNCAASSFDAYHAVLTGHPTLAPEWAPTLASPCTVAEPVIDIFVAGDVVAGGGGADGVHCPSVVDAPEAGHAPLCPARFPGTDWSHPRRVIALEYGLNQGLLLHELGHAFGLVDHQPATGNDPGALMTDGPNLMYGSIGCVSGATACRDRSLTEGQIHRMHWRNVSAATQELGLLPVGDSLRNCPEADTAVAPPRCPLVRTRLW